MENTDLIIKYLNCETTVDETKQVEAWRSENTANEKEFKKLQLAWKKAESTSRDIQSIDLEAEFKLFQKSISSQKKDTKVLQISSFKTSNNSFLRVAASIAIVLGIAYFIMNNKGSNPQFIAAEKVLEEKLLDGTEISLNIGSNLTYEKDFNVSNRRVKLQGEANFDVTHDKEKPFIIDAGKVFIKVLGTNFYVNTSDEDGNSEVILSEGSVEVTSKSTGEKQILTPGEKSEFIVTAKKFKKSRNTDKNYLSWRTRKLVFNHAKISYVAQKMMHTYGIEIKVNPQVRDCIFPNNVIDIDKTSLNQMLDMIKFGSQDHIKVIREKDRITLKGDCY